MLLREKVRAVRSVRVIDGIVLEAHVSLQIQFYKSSKVLRREEDDYILASNRHR